MNYDVLSKPTRFISFIFLYMRHCQCNLWLLLQVFCTHILYVSAFKNYENKQQHLLILHRLFGLGLLLLELPHFCLPVCGIFASTFFSLQFMSFDIPFFIKFPRLFNPMAEQFWNRFPPSHACCLFVTHHGRNHLEIYHEVSAI